MSTHNIDNDSEVHLFHFDDYGGSPSLYSAPRRTSPLDFGAATMTSQDDPTSEEPGEHLEDVLVGKGKGVTKPMPIRAPMAVVHDFFDASHSGTDLSSTGNDSHRPLFLPPVASSSFKPYHMLFDDNPRDFYPNTGDLPSVSDPAFDPWKEKGKGKEHPPILPPLAFSSTDFGYGQVSSPSLALISSSLSPSSYGSNYGLSMTSTNNEPETSDPAGSPVFPTTPPRPLSPSDIGRPVIRHMPSRSRSLSNLSVYSTRSLAARSMSRIKMKFSRPNTPSNLTRKLLFRKTTNTNDDLSSSANISPTSAIDDADPGMNNFPSQWRTDFKVDELDTTIARLSCLRLPDADSGPSNAFFCQPSPLRHKGRSKSSPLPLSALDYIPVTTTDIFAPIPVVVRNYFDELLPQELRIQVLASLVALHEADHLRAVREGRWTMAKAASSRSKWVGKDKGIRELVRMSRVSSFLDNFLYLELKPHTFQGL